MEETKIKVKRKKRDTLKFHKHDEFFREGNKNTYNNKSSLEFKFNTLTLDLVQSDSHTIHNRSIFNQMVLKT